jgi:hypothetical protein
MRKLEQMIRRKDDNQENGSPSGVLENLEQKPDTNVVGENEEEEAVSASNPQPTKTKKLRLLNVSQTPTISTMSLVPTVPKGTQEVSKSSDMSNLLAT